VAAWWSAPLRSLHEERGNKNGESWVSVVLDRFCTKLSESRVHPGRSSTPAPSLRMAWKKSLILRNPESSPSQEPCRRVGAASRRASLRPSLGLSLQATKGLIVNRSDSVRAILAFELAHSEMGASHGVEVVRERDIHEGTAHSTDQR